MSKNQVTAQFTVPVSAQQNSSGTSPKTGRSAIMKVDLETEIRKLVRFADRKPATEPNEMRRAFARVGVLGDVPIYVTSFAGESEWERH